MSHNTLAGMAVLAVGLTCGVALGQEASLGGSASTEVSVGASTDADAAASEQAVYETTAPQAPPIVESDRLVPVDGMVEIGLAVGLLVPSWRHNFHDEDRLRQRIHAAPELALRLAWFPIRFAGAEIEGAAGATVTSDGKRANPWSARVSAVGQVALWRVTPFGLFGFGRMGNRSKSMGNDGDPLFHVGAGAKAYLSELFALRFDVRDNLTQRAGSTDGMLTHSIELLLGASLTLGR